MLRALKNWFSGKQPSNRTIRRPARRSRLGLETLETREVLSASASYLLAGGKLYQETDSAKTLIDSGVRSYDVASTGRVYALQNNGVFLGSNDGLPGDFQKLDTSVKQFLLSSTGQVYDLRTGGGFLGSSDGLPGDFTMLDHGVKSMGMDPTGMVYALQTNGMLLSSSAGVAGSFTVADRKVSAMSVSTSSTLVLTDWFSKNLQDPGVAAVARTEFAADDAITRNDMLGLFNQAEADGTISAQELQSLRVVVSNSSLLNMPGYVHNLANKTLNNDPADASYQGQPLAMLAAGSSASVLQALVSKWFLGQDEPAAGTDAYYSPVSGTLFGSSGPLPTDVQQGQIGDCWLIAGLSEVAKRMPSVIKNMFIDNGDGTWSVRFYHNGAPDWVTVDSQLPDGGTLYDQPINGVLWVALAEKAYAQENASGWIPTGSEGNDSYAALNGGDPGWVLKALTGKFTQSTGVMSMLVADIWQQGDLVILATPPKPANPLIVGDHAYTVVNYNAATDTYTLLNPWGVNGGYDGNNYPGYITISGANLGKNFDMFSYTVPNDANLGGGGLPIEVVG
jgi:hypothetical protein